MIILSKDWRLLVAAAIAALTAYILSGEVHGQLLAILNAALAGLSALVAVPGARSLPASGGAHAVEPGDGA